MLQAFARYTTVGKTVVRAIRPTCSAFRPALFIQTRWQQTSRAFSTRPDDDEAVHKDKDHDADESVKAKVRYLSQAEPSTINQPTIINA